MSMCIAFEFIGGPDRAKRKGVAEIRIEKGQCDEGTPHEFTIGKENANIVIDSHPDAICSRNHAKLSICTSTGEVELEDLNSSNGTFVNKQRIKKHLVHSGDEIIFGGGQSIPFGHFMSLDQLAHPLITVWKIKIDYTTEYVPIETVDIPIGTSTPLTGLLKYQKSTSTKAENDQHSVNYGQLYGAATINRENDEVTRNDSVLCTDVCQKEAILDSNTHISSLSPPCQNFDEIMPRQPCAVKIGSFITTKVKRIYFEETLWNWCQLSPNPHEHGQFISLAIDTANIKDIRYGVHTEHQPKNDIMGSFYVCIEMKSVPPCVTAELYLSSMVNERMKGISKEQLVMEIIFFFEKKSTVQSLIASIKENYSLYDFCKRLNVFH